jgi:hypothetical protein
MAAATQLNPELAQAVADAQVLVSYASEAPALDLDEKIVATLTEAARLLQQGQLTHQQETTFWKALSDLSRAIAPVTIFSLRATMDAYTPESGKVLGFDIGRRSKARWAVYVYTLGLSLTLAVLLVCQVYWIFGNWVVNDIQKQKKEITEIETKLRNLRLAVPAQKPPAKPVSQNAEDLELNILRTHLRTNQLQLDTSYNLLSSWSAYWANSMRVAQFCDQGGSDGDMGRVAACRNIAHYQSSLVVLDVFQRYVLPLLYGLLGCCVYILRTLSAEIRQRTYSEASNIGFRIRLYLGTLGGMVVAWFVTPESADGLFKSLSPLALAFLAGYSIELVFTALDRLISAFTKPSTESNTANPAHRPLA